MGQDAKTPEEEERGDARRDKGTLKSRENQQPKGVDICRGSEVTVVSSAQVRTEKLCFVPWEVIKGVPGKPLEDNKNRS